MIANKLNQGILKLETIEKTVSDKIRVGFVGKPRFKSVVAFAKVLCERYKNFEFHIYGGPILEEKDGFEALSRYGNYFYHGPFKNPDDLPEIYSKLDLVLSTYDIEFENVRYAEPNKLYEAIFLFVLSGVLILMLYKFKSKDEMAVYLVSYGIWRFVIEFFRDDPRGGFITFISPSQFWSILIWIGIVPLFFFLKKKVFVEKENEQIENN